MTGGMVGVFCERRPWQRNREIPLVWNEARSLSRLRNFSPPRLHYYMDGVNPDLVGRGRLFLGVRTGIKRAHLGGWVGDINAGSPDFLVRRLFESASSDVGGCRTTRGVSFFPDQRSGVERRGAGMNGSDFQAA